MTRTNRSAALRLGAGTVAALTWSLYAGAQPRLPAHHAPTTTAVVRYDDLDLTTNVGVETLYQRIRGAARRACSIGTSTDVVGRQEAYSACLKDSVANAVSQLRNVQLSALAESRSPLVAE